MGSMKLNQLLSVPSQRKLAVTAAQHKGAAKEMEEEIPVAVTNPKELNQNAKDLKGKVRRNDVISVFGLFHEEEKPLKMKVQTVANDILVLKSNSSSFGPVMVRLGDVQMTNKGWSANVSPYTLASVEEMQDELARDNTVESSSKKDKENERKAEEDTRDEDTETESKSKEPPEDDDEDSSELKVLVDNGDHKQANKIYTQYISEEDFSKYHKFLKDFDRLLFEYRNHKAVSDKSDEEGIKNTSDTGDDSDDDDNSIGYSKEGGGDSDEDSEQIKSSFRKTSVYAIKASLRRNLGR